MVCTFVLSISLQLYVSIVMVHLLGLLGMYPSAGNGLRLGCDKVGIKATHSKTDVA